MAGFLAVTIHLLITAKVNIVGVGEEKFRTHFYFDYFDIDLTYDTPSITARHRDGKQFKKRRAWDGVGVFVLSPRPFRFSNHSSVACWRALTAGCCRICCAGKRFIFTFHTINKDFCHPRAPSNNRFRREKKDITVAARINNNNK